MSPPASSTCAVCGAPLDAGGCPRCLMVAAMVPTAHADEGARQPPPSLEAVTAAFPQLEILEFIGEGGMGCVFKARQPKLNRFIALKLLPASLAERDAAFAGRFEREGQLLARLHHPNIVAVHDSGTAGEFFYLIMEFVDGVNLRQAMRARRFTPAQALAIVPHICDALQYAHDEGVLHRDIKPENILLDPKGRVKLADFGIAKLLADSDTLEPTAATADTGLTQSGTALGTPNYMAPEQRDTPADVDHRADIYSLGVVFYELLTGELPRERFAPPSAKSDADPRVDAIVQQALEKERARRQHSAGEMKTQVENVTAASAGAMSGEHGERRFRPSAIAWLALGFLLAAILVPALCLALFRLNEGGLVFSGLCFLLALIFGLMTRRERMGKACAIAAVAVPLAAVAIIAAVLLGDEWLAKRRTAERRQIVEANLREAEVARATLARGDIESWSYTPRHLSEAKFIEWQKSAKGERAELSNGTTFKHESGVITLTGPRERVRMLATALRVLDQPEVENPLELPILNMPPDFFLRIAWPSLMQQDDFAKSPFTDTLRESLKHEGVTAPQLARALSAHVLELEKAAFVNSGAPFESIVRSPGASTFYDTTIPCADQPDKPLTLRIERTTQQMGTQSKFASFAPWLIEEAKKQSKERLSPAEKGEAKDEPAKLPTPPLAPAAHADLEGIFEEYEQLLTALREATFELELVGVSEVSETDKQQRRAGIKRKCDQLADQTAMLREKILALGKRATEARDR